MVNVNSDQAFMSVFLLICTIANLWFVYSTSKRAFGNEHGSKPDKIAYNNVTNATFIMALYDFPWVFLCFIQCWYNLFTSGDEPFNQSSGDDNVGCRFMGWYSTFSLTSMMGSHCLVAYYLLKLIRVRIAANERRTVGFFETTKGFMVLALTILIVACLFASMPFIQGDGYLFTNGGFCYADFTNRTQSSIILAIVLLFLTLSTALWYFIGVKDLWYFYAVFFVTWFLWIPACIYGIKNQEEIPSPYFIVGAIIGHGNALLNPYLYGVKLYDFIDSINNIQSS